MRCSSQCCQITRCGLSYFLVYFKSGGGKRTHSVCSRTRSDLHFLYVQTGPGLWRRKLDPDHPETPAVLQGRAPVLRCLRYTVLQHHGTTVGQNELQMNAQVDLINISMQVMLDWFLPVGWCCWTQDLSLQTSLREADPEFFWLHRSFGGQSLFLFGWSWPPDQSGWTSGARTCSLSWKMTSLCHCERQTTTHTPITSIGSLLLRGNLHIRRTCELHIERLQNQT